eukprot:TRINITY_DN65801_c0_g1_i1.p1 TRINITY_DN65801_c0_g1~~TRINITY_DN65801_c0_g1_i1.p1  ORF type:complete len:327 (+),score=62.77 TRINITY_DN65801_c0_g1_i1:148-1128(+)
MASLRSAFVFLLVFCCNGQRLEQARFSSWFGSTIVSDHHGFLHRETHEFKKEAIDHGSEGVEQRITNLDCVDGNCHISTSGVFRNMMPSFAPRMPPWTHHVMQRVRDVHEKLRPLFTVEFPKRRQPILDVKFLDRRPEHPRLPAMPFLVWSDFNPNDVNTKPQAEETHKPQIVSAMTGNHQPDVISLRLAKPLLLGVMSLVALGLLYAIGWMLGYNIGKPRASARTVQELAQPLAEEASWTPSVSMILEETPSQIAEVSPQAVVEDVKDTTDDAERVIEQTQPTTALIASAYLKDLYRQVASSMPQPEKMKFNMKPSVGTWLCYKH